MPSHGEITIERPTPDVAVVVLGGEHDLATRDEIGNTLTAQIDENDLVLVDFCGVTFVDSSVIAVLFDAHRQATRERKTFRVQLHTEAIVAKVFEISGVLSVVECVSTRSDGLGRRGLSHA